MNNQRILSFDILRGFAALGLAPVHTLWMYADKATQFESPLGSFVHFMGQQTVIFLMLMGMSMTLSRNQTPIKLLQRGLLLMCFGYVMNLLKFIVPIAVFGTMPEAFINAYGWQSPLETSQLLYLFLTGDVLQLAGLALLLIAFIKTFADNKWIYLAVATLIMLSCGELRGLQIGNPSVDYFLDLLWSKNYNIYFPLFPWATPILIGIFLGYRYLELGKDFNRLFKETLIPSIALILVGAALTYSNAKYHFNDFFHLGPGGIILFTVGNWLFFMLVHQLVSRVDFGKVGSLLVYCSKNVTSIYIIQWVTICWMMGIVGYHTLNMAETLAIAPFMLALVFIIKLSMDFLLSYFKKGNKISLEKASDSA